jgi:HD-GYP domain-containing protein (c-di-GMP phosphodiesterase class II)
MTLRMARTAGLPEEDMVHIRRGALLHDIGKMGISDRLLLKTGPLTPEEWDEMRKHPVYALELLRPIAYLRPALDIPYCHHEKWDGTGYPRGLKGEEIPLVARLFAVVDVFDALTHDRRYRAAWTRGKALDHIREGSGSHFDPKAVELFMGMLMTGRLAPDAT